MAMGENELGFWQGGASGALAGATLGAYLAGPTGGLSIAAGAAIGGIAGLLGGGAISNAQSNQARRAKVNAQNALRDQNRQSQIQAAGVQQQADNLVATRASSGQSSGGQTPGYIGANTTNTSGTF